MVKASSQIEKELGLLQQRTEDMAKALEPLHQSYLEALAEASKQQLMAAAYHLCTQAYPDKFLGLSWQQRNQLQKSLQKLATQIHIQLTEQQAVAKKNSRKPQRNNGLAFLQRLLEARSTGTVIQTKEGSSEDLLDKLSEIARFEPEATGTNQGRVESEDDWQNDVPPAEPAEEDVEVTDKDIEAALNDLQDPEGRSIKDVSEEAASEEAASESSEDFDWNTGTSNSRASNSQASNREHLRRNALDREELDTEELDSEGLDSEALDFEMEIPAAEQRLTLTEEDDLLGALEALARRSIREEAEENETDQVLTPVHLVKQQVLMEKAIREVFKAVSEEANALLQQANVMPSFPKALMAAAADSRGLGEPLNAVPNVVKVSVRVMHGEANFDMIEGGEEEPKDPGAAGYDTDYGKGRSQGKKGDRGPSGRKRSRRLDERGQSSHRANGSSSRSDSSSGGRAKNRRSLPSSGSRDGRLSREFIPPDAVEIEAFPEFAVINLQLSEVEFTDPRVSVWRNRLRKELSNLKQLGVRYQKTQRSLETAKAEDAWRSSWTGLKES